MTNEKAIKMLDSILEEFKGRGAGQLAKTYASEDIIYDGVEEWTAMSTASLLRQFPEHVTDEIDAMVNILLHSNLTKEEALKEQARRIVEVMFGMVGYAKAHETIQDESER